MSMVSSRRTLYPPWRIPLYRTFQERMLTMVLGLHPEAKEKLLGIMSASNTFLMYYMRGPPEIAAIFKHNLLIHTDLGILSMKQKTKRIQSFLGCFGRSAANSSKYLNLLSTFMQLCMHTQMWMFIPVH